MQTTISELFSDQRVSFKIPAYQRAYSWDDENILQFIQDLREARQSYYLGHFLFEQEASAPNELLVIDGQQRLTTCVILFSVLRRELARRKLAKETVAVDEDDIRHYYLRDVRKHTQRFVTVPDDNNFFVDEVIDAHEESGNHTPTTKSQARIRKARLLFEEVCSPSQTISTSELERWHELLTKAVCTEFRVKDKVEAAQIFAFQNDRGKSLSNLEKLKSYFMLQLYLHSGSPEAMGEHIRYLEADFSAIYRQIVRINMQEDNVLLSYWRACTESDGFESGEPVVEIKEYLRNISSPEVCAWVKSFVRRLGKAFELVEQIETHPGENIRNLRMLNNLAIAYPFFIRAHLHSASWAQLDRLAKLLENVTFRYLIRGGRAEIESRLNRYLRAAADGGYVDRVVAGIVQALRSDGWWIYWADSTLEEHLDGWMYGNRVDNYVLWRYEMYLCAASDYAAPVKVSYSDLMSQASIEHIAPQTPTNGDPLAHGYGVYHDKQNPDEGIESGSWMNCLGNLLLISQSHNSSIGNKPFQHKLASYGRDNLLNQQKEVRDFVGNPASPVWDKGAIERRHVAILEAARNIWSLSAI